ncbi:hypothetical protein GGX14DRAFT_600578 [Mycena pura]|uniref:Uncharacterized protein n=1 Tax=Mycena pura TaxID=153505 RepID=A0AAD6XXD3_9AGAR|nr:hypothetical protein GGX14DRAFT_600578 [Mycena pura]
MLPKGFGDVSRINVSSAASKRSVCRPFRPKQLGHINAHLPLALPASAIARYPPRSQSQERPPGLMLLIANHSNGRSSMMAGLTLVLLESLALRAEEANWAPQIASPPVPTSDMSAFRPHAPVTPSISNILLMHFATKIGSTFAVDGWPQGTKGKGLKVYLWDCGLRFRGTRHEVRAKRKRATRVGFGNHAVTGTDQAVH